MSSRLRTLSIDTVDFFPLLPGIYKQHDDADNDRALYPTSGTDDKKNDQIPTTPSAREPLVG